jgi:hypothetical protein
MSRSRGDSALSGLLAEVEMAGAAMACRFSSSAEYEAALIDERRRAGAYDVSARQRRWMWLALAVLITLAILLSI